MTAILPPQPLRRTRRPAGAGLHLGELVAGLIDGELDDTDRDRALAHVAGCAACHAEMTAQRRVKSALRSLAPEPADAPPALTERLRALSAAAPQAGAAPARTASPAGTARPRPAAAATAATAGMVASAAGVRPPAAGARTAPAGGVRPGPLPSASRRGNRRPPVREAAARPAGRRYGYGRRRLQRVLVGATSAVLLSLGTAFAVGGPGTGGGPAGPVVQPSVDQFTAEHAATAGEVPFTGPAIGANIPVSFSGGSTRR